MFKKNLPQQAEKLPKYCAEEQKPGAFQRICPTFQKLFLKSYFFDSFNGLRYLRVGGAWTNRQSRKNSKSEKCL